MIRFAPIPTETVRALQAGGLDAYGMAPERQVSDGGGNPCRHCLGMIAQGAGMLVLAHRPFPALQAYAETGPIFLCADPCPAGGGEVLPAMLASPDYILRGYGADDRIVYGGPSPEEDEPPYLGIARWLTTWGDGKVNANVASRDVLLTIPELTEWEAEDILEKRLGLDEQPGTRDDGFTSVDDMMARAGINPGLSDRFNTRTLNYIKVVSIGDADGVQYAITCTFQVQGAQMVILAWREEPVY